MRHEIGAKCKIGPRYPIVNRPSGICSGAPLRPNPAAGGVCRSTPTMPSRRQIRLRGSKGNRWREAAAGLRPNPKKAARSIPDRLSCVNGSPVGRNYSAFRKSMEMVLPSYVHCS